MYICVWLCVSFLSSFLACLLALWSAIRQLPAGAGDEQKGRALLRKERLERRKRKRVNLLQKEGGEQQSEDKPEPSSGEAQVGRPLFPE